jgi:hypothetical protein
MDTLDHRNVLAMLSIDILASSRSDANFPCDCSMPCQSIADDAGFDAEFDVVVVVVVDSATHLMSWPIVAFVDDVSAYRASMDAFHYSNDVHARDDHDYDAFDVSLCSHAIVARDIVELFDILALGFALALAAAAADFAEFAIA